VDLWLAKVTFAESSVIDVQYVNNEFRAVARLTGDINIESAIGSTSPIKIEKFTFEDLVIASDQPVVHPGVWKAPSVGCQFKGFSFFVRDIKLDKKEESGKTLTYLNFNAEITLATSDAHKLKLAAGGNLDIISEVVLNAQKEQKWKYKDVDLNSFSIDCSTNAFHLKGDIFFAKEDPVYGECFYGGLIFSMKQPSLTIGAAAIFGKTKSKKNPNETYRYFFVDVFAKLPVPIPLGPLEIPGIGGGVSWRMEKQEFNTLQLANAPTVANATTTPVVSALSPKSLTGAVYVPDESTSLGIKLMATFEMAGPPPPATDPTTASILNGAAALEVVFKGISKNLKPVLI
jgi:hypothetical protein